MSYNTSKTNGTIDTDIVTELRAFGANGYMIRAAKEIEILRNERDGYLSGIQQTLRALAEANQLAQQRTRERDEARREVCNLTKWDHYGPRHYAQHRKWDCFKENTNV